jgi:uncharacterized membrane protein YkoI
MKALIGVSLLLGTLVALPAASGEQPPEGSKTLQEIISGAERSGYGPITEVSFDDGVWEVEAYKGDTAFEVTLDATSGEVVSEHRDDGDTRPPAGSMSLSKIVDALTDAGYQNLNDLSFERKSWEVEATRGNQKRELRVDAKNGKVISDRVDD